MHIFFDALRQPSVVLKSAVLAASITSFLFTPAHSQTSVPPAQAPPISASDTQHPSAVKDPLLHQGAFTIQTVGGEIKEEQIKPLLVGKTLYLRDGYQDNHLEFDEHGQLIGNSPRGSYTLSQIQINKVKLSKHKLELEGDRYALHFLGAAPFDDPTAATDRVKITPKKKNVRISFEREQVATPKKKKHKEDGKRDEADAKSAAPAEATSSPAEPEKQNAPSADPAGTDEVALGKTSATTSPAHASQLLLAALDKVFSSGIDDRMIAAMPDFWKLYYQSAAAKTDYKPSDPAVFHQASVDQKAKLISVLDPPSNEFAQANGIAGIALYHAIIGPDGKAQQVVAGRPIGFGLDENAVATIHKATFQPAMKDGKPVPVALDLVVSFRIYSKRTSQSAPQQASEKPDAPVLPGPYSAQTTSQGLRNPATPQPTNSTPKPPATQQ